MIRGSDPQDGGVLNIYFLDIPCHDRCLKYAWTFPPSGRGDDLAERPADVFPEVIWAVDSDEEYLPVVFSCDEEEVGEVQVGTVGGGDDVFGGEDEDMPQLFIDLDFEFDVNINGVMELDNEDDEDTDDEDTDDSDETGKDSGYGSMSEDEELIEDIDEEDTLVQQLPPGKFPAGMERRVSSRSFTSSCHRSSPAGRRPPTAASSASSGTTSRVVYLVFIFN